MWGHLVKKFKNFTELGRLLSCSHGSPLFRIMSQLKPVDALPTYFWRYKIFNSALRYRNGWISFQLPRKCNAELSSFPHRLPVSRQTRHSDTHVAKTAAIPMHVTKYCNALRMSRAGRKGGDYAVTFQQRCISECTNSTNNDAARQGTGTTKLQNNDRLLHLRAGQSDCSSSSVMCALQ